MTVSPTASGELTCISHVHTIARTDRPAREHCVDHLNREVGLRAIEAASFGAAWLVLGGPH